MTDLMKPLRERHTCPDCSGQLDEDETSDWQELRDLIVYQDLYDAAEWWVA